MELHTFETPSRSDLKHKKFSKKSLAKRTSVRQTTLKDWKSRTIESACNSITAAAPMIQSSHTAKMSKLFAAHFPAPEVVFAFWVTSLLALFPHVAAGADKPVRRWKIEYERDGKWASNELFDTRQEAQDKLDHTRQLATPTKSNPVTGRVVPTDWGKWEHLGALSAKYESGGRASATVSSGKGDPGGVSYGSYQLSSKVGTAQRFVDQYYVDWFHNTKPGSDEFSALWKQLAAERGPELAVYEHLFIADTHYQPFAVRLQKDLSLDLDKHSSALRDVAWSTAVQHGSGNKIFHRALEPAIQEHRLDQLSDEEIIKLVYQERGRLDASGKSVYFSKSSPKVQKSVLSRFNNEAQDALKELAEELSASPRQ